MKSKNAPKKRIRKSTVKCVQVYLEDGELKKDIKYIDRDTFIRKLHETHELSEETKKRIHRQASRLLDFISYKDQSTLDMRCAVADKVFNLNIRVADQSRMDAFWAEL